MAHGNACVELLQTILCITICLQCFEQSNRLARQQPATVVVVKEQEAEASVPTSIQMERDSVEAFATATLPLLAIPASE